MSTLPELNHPIVIRDGNGREYLSRVEDLTPGVLTLARPIDLPATDPFGVGAELLVTWPSARGTAVLPVRLIQTLAQGRVQLWVVAVLGDARFEQRRAYVRVLASGPMTLRTTSEDGEVEVIPARLIDVSEGGLRCSVNEAADADGLTEGVEVTSRFSLRDTEFDLPGRIWTGGSTVRAEVIVLFEHQLVRQADALRRQVFAQQIYHRRS